MSANIEMHISNSVNPKIFSARQIVSDIRRFTDRAGLLEIESAGIKRSFGVTGSPSFYFSTRF